MIQFLALWLAASIGFTIGWVMHGRAREMRAIDAHREMLRLERIRSYGEGDDEDQHNNEEN